MSEDWGNRNQSLGYEENRMATPLVHDSTRIESSLIVKAPRFHV